jgi:(p)ppGpp synthase/HD superfamily hydrolase
MNGCRRFTPIALGTGEAVLQHALGTALIAASLRLDADTRLAALCFAVGDVLPHPIEEVASRYGEGLRSWWTACAASTACASSPA